MKILLLVALSLTSGFLSLRAQTVGQAVARIHRERILSSYLLAFGRPATEDEVKYWLGQNPKSVADLVTRHRDYLGRDRGTHQDTIRRSYLAALGRAPTDAEIKHWMGGTDSFTTLVNHHVAWLRSNPAEYENVIKRSYQNILGRAATGAETSHWKGQGVLAYSVLAACHDDWKKRGGERPGRAVLPAASPHLHTVSVSPEVFAEARVALGSLIGNDGGSIVGNAGGNLVAAGAGNMVAAGGGNMVAAGGGNMVAAGGGN